MLNVFTLANGRLFQEEIDDSATLAHVQPIWVDLEAPTDEEKGWISSRFGLTIPSDAVDDDQCTVCDAQCRTCVRNERGVTRRIDQIYLCILVFGVGEIVVKRYFAFYRIFVVVGYGGAFVDLTPSSAGTGNVEHRTDELGFTCVAVSNDSQIPDIISCKCFHFRQVLLS